MICTLCNKQTWNLTAHMRADHFKKESDGEQSQE